MSFDAKQHAAARRLWLIGLNVARATEDPLATDQTIFLLYDMAVQAMHVQRPGEALGLIHLGHAAAAGSYPVSAATSCWLASVEARAHAARGDAAGCDHALGWASVPTTPDPGRCPWRISPGPTHWPGTSTPPSASVTRPSTRSPRCHSPRAYDRLHALHTALQPLHTSPGIAELRERLSATAA